MSSSTTSPGGTAATGARDRAAPQASPRPRETRVAPMWRNLALVAIALVTWWFWIVAAHRIDGQPYIGFAPVFITNTGDFEHFYHAARAMREGRDIYASGVHGYIYPPLIAFVFMPLTFFSVKTAALIMLVVNLALGLACAWLVSVDVVRRFEIGDSADKVIVVAAVTLLLSATKLRSEFQMWQTNVLMMLPMLLALRVLDTRPVLAGLLLGAAANVKYLPLVFLPYLLLRRRYGAAAGFVAGMIAFALLPALQTGWAVNAGNWATALSGLAHLLGFAAPASESANIDPISIGHSISVTSGISRMLGDGASPAQAMAFAGLVAAATVASMVWAYLRAGVPVLRWPDALAQRAEPYLGMVAIEWAALMTLALAFSPQTNPRHTSLLLMTFAPLAAMLCFPREGGSRLPSIAATAILFLGLVLPPNIVQFMGALTWWRHVGGAGWCMALMLPFLVVAGLRYVGTARPHRPPAARVRVDTSRQPTV